MIPHAMPAPASEHAPGCTAHPASTYAYVGSELDCTCDRTLAAPAHGEECDGYGACHSPVAVREVHQGRTLYRSGCSVGCELEGPALASSEETARALAAVLPHGWGFEECGGCA